MHPPHKHCTKATRWCLRAKTPLSLPLPPPPSHPGRFAVFDNFGAAATATMDLELDAAPRSGPLLGTEHGRQRKELNGRSLKPRRKPTRINRKVQAVPTFNVTTTVRLLPVRSLVCFPPRSFVHTGTRVRACCVYEVNVVTEIYLHRCVCVCYVCVCGTSCASSASRASFPCRAVPCRVCSAGSHVHIFLYLQCQLRNGTICTLALHPPHARTHMLHGRGSSRVFRRVSNPKRAARSSILTASAPAWATMWTRRRSRRLASTCR